jgi:hypothetical protein
MRTGRIREEFNRLKAKHKLPAVVLRFNPRLRHNSFFSDRQNTITLRHRWRSEWNVFCLLHEFRHAMQSARRGFPMTFKELWRDELDADRFAITHFEKIYGHPPKKEWSLRSDLAANRQGYKRFWIARH